MSVSRSSVQSRPVVIAMAVFAVLVLLDMALFGWMIFRSLSEREIEKVLLETRQEAETIAEKIARKAEVGGEDLYTAIARERETQTYIDSTLRQRQIVQDVQIFDKKGRLVFHSENRETIPVRPQGEPELSSPEVPPKVDKREEFKEFQYGPPEVEVPIGNIGKVKIGISAEELSRRIGVLRRDLIRQASLVGGVALLLLMSAYGGIWLLLRRARRLELQAVEAERLAYIGTLASGLAHEIRNPLNSLNLNMQLLEEEMGPGKEGSHRRLLSITRSEISRLERLVTDFLSYARPRSLELEELSPEDILEPVVGVLAGEIQRRGACVTVEDRSGGARVRADLGQMKQLILNLANNALAATDDSPRPPAIKLAAYRQAAFLVLEVADNGAGIPEKEQERIFDLFYSNRKGGTGLGLAIVQRIVRIHGGRIELRSTPGIGTSFRIHLPLVAGEEPVAEPEAIERPVGA